MTLYPTQTYVSPEPEFDIIRVNLFKYSILGNSLSIFAKDNHQYENGLFYKNKNCCCLLEQNNITSEILLKKLLQIIENENDYLEKIKNMKKFQATKQVEKY